MSKPTENKVSGSAQRRIATFLLFIVSTNLCNTNLCDISK